MLKKIPTDYFDTSKGTLKLLWEEEWRGLGITQVFRSCLVHIIDVIAIVEQADKAMSLPHLELGLGTL